MVRLVGKHTLVLAADSVFLHRARAADYLHLGHCVHRRRLPAVERGLGDLDSCHDALVGLCYVPDV